MIHEPTRLRDKMFSHKFWWRVVLVILLFAFTAIMIDFIVMPFYTKHGKEYELPDVTDRPVDQALEILKQEGFNPLVQDSVYDDQFSPGAVIQQNPSPFSRVKKGRRVYLIVSIGEAPRYIPQLIGLTPQDAEFRIKEHGLELRRTFYEFSDLYPRGVVINQSIPAGEEALKNQKLNITVSLGPAPSSLEVSNLVGKSIETARKEIEALGIPLGKIILVYRPQLVPGTILNQSVPPGTPITKIETINLLVSTDQPPLEDVSDKDTLLNNR